MKTFTDASFVTFGKYRLGGADPRALGQMPLNYIKWLNTQDFVYRERELAEYIAARLERGVRDAIKERLADKLKNGPPRDKPAYAKLPKNYLSDFAKNL